MTHTLRLAAFAALAAASAPSARCATSRIATQDWVRRMLADGGVAVTPSASAATNVVDGVTNVTYSSAFRCADATNCAAISLTFSLSPASATPVLRSRAAAGTLAAASASAGGGAVTVTVTGGYYTDMADRDIRFDFGDGGFTFETPYERPAEVSAEHACALGEDCVCVEWGADADRVEVPEEYGIVTKERLLAYADDPAAWIDADSWPGVIKTAPNGRRTFWVVAADGTMFNMVNIMRSYAWLEALLVMATGYNEYVDECAANYRKAHVCDRDSGEPQHDWVECSCGSASWATCRRYPSHKQGTESHAYAGGQGDAVSHPCVCGATAQPHQWGPSEFAGYSGEYATFVSRCAVCGRAAVSAQPLSGFADCLPDIGLHVPKGEGECGCRCGEGTDSDLDSAAFHAWDGAEVRGVSNCLCVCGSRHVFREPTTYWKNQHPDEWCEGVCQSCRHRTKGGGEAAEADHAPKPRGRRSCGCRCGWFGVDQEHTDGGREARTQRLHVQSQAYSLGGGATAPAFCQCFGTGEGGRWHWHYPFADSSCSAVCQHLHTGDSALGHLAAGEPSPTSGCLAPATPYHHKGRTYGCGCACGRCGEGNRDDWKGNPALHRPAQDADDQCHCSCESKRLVGSGIGGHEFVGTSCTCTCGQAYRSSLNACGVCQGGDGSISCGMIHDGARRREDVAGNHDYAEGYCVCRCGANERAHDFGDGTVAGEPATVYCQRCGAQFARYPLYRVCRRTQCGEREFADYRYDGTHLDGCSGDAYGESSPTPDTCAECGHLSPGHNPGCSGYASPDGQGQTDDTGSVREI